MPKTGSMPIGRPSAYTLLPLVVVGIAILRITREPSGLMINSAFWRSTVKARIDFSLSFWGGGERARASSESERADDREETFLRGFFSVLDLDSTGRFLLK